ncbi:MAG: adenylosuccinate synthetase [Patescibacteria group bacterium]
MHDASQWLDVLSSQNHGRRWLTLFGGDWGDGGKGNVESVIAPHFEVFVRVSGGANTGRTRFVHTDNGDKEFIFHLIPSGWADDKESIIGDWVLIDLPRLTAEIDQLASVMGRTPHAPLRISPRAPLYLPYHGIWEALIEWRKGADAVGTTKRGIAPMIAGIDLRIGPVMSHLQHPDVLRKFVEQFYAIFATDFQQFHDHLEREADRIAEAGGEAPVVFSMDELAPATVLEQLLADAAPVLEYVDYHIGRRLIDLGEQNVPTLFGLTQGWGLTRWGTYPFNSSTQTTPQAAPFCANIPSKYFGGSILVLKLDPTRVGWGGFPTGLWNRRDAEAFPKQHPELFSALPGHDPLAREQFLAEMRQTIMDTDGTDRVALAKYIQVFLNELGATSGRGREPGLPDLFSAACAAQSSGADTIALTRVDFLSGLKLSFKLGTTYRIDGEPCMPPDYPCPIEQLDRVTVDYATVPVDLRGVDLYGATELPDCFEQILSLYEQHTGVPVGLVSTSPKPGEGKIFRLGVERC